MICGNFVVNKLEELNHNFYCYRRFAVDPSKTIDFLRFFISYHVPLLFPQNAGISPPRSPNGIILNLRMISQTVDYWENIQFGCSKLHAKFLSILKIIVNLSRWSINSSSLTFENVWKSPYWSSWSVYICKWFPFLGNIKFIQ